ncbi:hypothetical protein [Salinigranum salinum]|uniref:hypothetical protein n=1 Tax=Salinigranum salinum TaxID=1364937 RepID=UPI001260A6F8|nr:hypothetical protein [Salinigranum salinum]
MSTGENGGDDDGDAGRELVRRMDEIDFRDLIYGTAASVASAQSELDRNLAASMVEFAETKVDVVPRVTRTIEDDGTVTHTPAETEERSLLDLGLTPTRYQFSEATVDVEFDLSFGVSETETEDETRKSRLRVDTSEAHHQRRYYGTIDTTAKVSARLVPVPTPAAFTPATVETSGEPTGTDEAESDDESDDGSDGGTADTAESDDEGGGGTADTAESDDEGGGGTSDHTDERDVA